MHRPSPQERALYDALKDALQKYGIDVSRSEKFSYEDYNGKTKRIKPDITVPVSRLAIEVDGSHHTHSAEQQRKDRLRDKTIAEHGYEVIRVPNYRVRGTMGLDEVVNEIIPRAVSRRDSFRRTSDSDMTLVGGIVPKVEHRRSSFRRKLIAPIFVMGAVILALMFALQSLPETSTAPFQEPALTVEAIRGQPDAIKITNPFHELMTVSITYRRESRFFGVDEIANAVVTAGAGEEIILQDPKWADNSGCTFAGPCGITILNYIIID